MPRLSLYRDNKQNDYRFLDKTISEMLTVGGTDLYIHKYLGPKDQGPSIDSTQPQYAELSPSNIQDLLFLENRDRKYDTNIYRLRGHYNVMNLDFDLSQFGLFLNNDIIFITVHYNDMIDIIGRKLMVGDVIELPHLLDYNPLDDSIKYALKRFYQITDANYASEGFSSTWYPHLWRIKCEPLVNSQEFADILNQPQDKDNYLGDWDKNKVYPPGYTITFGDTIYESIKEVPIGITIPNTEYWKELANDSLTDIISTYNKNIAVNNAVLEEAKRLLPLSGYDRENLYVVPTYGVYGEGGGISGKLNQPAPPININTSPGAPATVGTVVMMRNPAYKNPSPVVRIPKAALQSIWDMTADTDITSLESLATVNMETFTIAPNIEEGGSYAIDQEKGISVYSLGIITGPYGTADNTYATADADPEASGFTGTISQQMDWRADCDPRFQYIARSSPRSFGYTMGYLDGTAQAPNGYPTGVGISFPQRKQTGDYFLRIDYFPNILYRWDGQIWVRISNNVRTGTGIIDGEDFSQRSIFINNNEQTRLTDGSYIPQKQALSTILTVKPDTLPPRSKL